MRNLLVYYAAILVPLTTLVLLVKYGEISSMAFGILILSYAVFYHPMISGKRLIDLELIGQKDFSKNFIPGWNWKYSKQLFLGV